MVQTAKKFFKRGGLSFLILSFSLMACNDNAGSSASTEDTTANTGNETASGGNNTDTSGNHAVAVLTATFKDTVVGGSALFDEMPNGKVQLRLELNIPSKAGKTV